MRPELIVAEKEFGDHITSKRFVVIFGILLLLAIYTISTGMDSYNQKLDEYKNPRPASDYQYKQQTIDHFQQLIDDAQVNNMTPESVKSLQDQIDQMEHPPMPSPMDVFQTMIFLFTLVGMVLGASLGFDQIARERGRGSLKFLVTSPIYRDVIINGKTTGVIGTLAGAMGAALAVAIAIMMLKGIVPNLEELIRIVLFFLTAMLYCLVFFALAMMVSALSRNTAMAAITMVGMIFLMFIIMVLISLLSGIIAGMIVGPAPVNDFTRPQPMPVVMNESTDNVITYSYQPYEETEMFKYSNRLSATRSDVTNILSAFSPIDDFSGYLGNGHMGNGPAPIAENTHAYMYAPFASVTDGEKISLLDSLLSIWIKVLALIVEITAAFGVAYVAFMRADVR
jgi:ABC-2 type transport system permease protein